MLWWKMQKYGQIDCSFDRRDVRRHSLFEIAVVGAREHNRRIASLLECFRSANSDIAWNLEGIDHVQATRSFTTEQLQHSLVVHDHD
jgi:hypothetical protein